MVGCSCKQAQKTMATNYFGTAKVCDAFIPLIAPQGQIINIASESGHLSILTANELKMRFNSPTLTIEDVNELVNEFIEDAAGNSKIDYDWPRSAYGTSKLVLIAYTRALSRVLAGQGILVNSCCPGYCATNISNFRGTSPPEKGAETPVWLALGGSLGDTGEFYAKCKKMQW
jgi:carbonyl reductase 1